MHTPTNRRLLSIGYKLTTGLFVCVVSLFCAPGAMAQEPKPDTTPPDSREYYFFNPEEFGSNAFCNPLQYAIEGGAPGGRDFSTFEFRKATKELYVELTNPIDALNKYGWGKFFYREFTPHIGEGGNWVPNYLWHLVGGGFRTRQLEEYYHYHGYKHPRLYAWMAMYSMHLWNELSQVEQFMDLSEDKQFGDAENNTVDALADLLFFDWVGKVIFSYDPVADFAANTLHLREWSYQSQFNPATNSFINNGQVYWMRYEVMKPVSISFLTSTPISSLGLSYEVKPKHHFSVGIGQNAKAIDRDDNGELVAGAIVYNFGAYYSVDDIPVVVFSYSPRDQIALDRFADDYDRYKKYTEVIHLNVYPGLVDINGAKPGIAFAFLRETVFIGITNGRWPAGVIFGSERRPN